MELPLLTNDEENSNKQSCMQKTTASIYTFSWHMIVNILGSKATLDTLQLLNPKYPVEIEEMVGPRGMMIYSTCAPILISLLLTGAENTKAGKYFFNFRINTLHNTDRRI